ncbi:hypothetical protein [Gulosibacter faecalis]|jgi:hypothetical protein|uniref:DUF4190 domain-containing protein n=1 Tax=Gulosibacter faecalis TaxID=272240 RepID=A0ABW5UU80_9MICO|nr:hypothetical protein [Gulosibacter faecalis]
MTYGQQPYQQPQQGYQPYAQQPYQPARPDDGADSVGSWVLTIFLLGIPLVGLIYVIVLAVGDGRSVAKRNFARATLIWMLIGVALSIIAFVVIWAVGGTIALSFWNEFENSSSTVRVN